MLYWEAKRRYEFLKRFREKVVAYDNNAQWNYDDNDWDENEEAVRRRRQVNEDMAEVTTACQEVGHSTIIHYSPPPLIGGFEGEIDVLTNIFRLPSLGVDFAQLLDRLDRVIGVYRWHVSHLWRQLFNPLYWLALIGAVPFRILRRAGFNVERAETSLFGKLVKASISFLTLIYFSLAILEKLDLLAPVIVAVKRLGGYHP